MNHASNSDHEFSPILSFDFWSPFCLVAQHMAAGHPLAPPANEQASGPRAAVTARVALEQALVPSLHATLEAEGIALTPALVGCRWNWTVRIRCAAFACATCRLWNRAS